MNKLIRPFADDFGAKLASFVGCTALTWINVHRPAMRWGGAGSPSV